MIPRHRLALATAALAAAVAAIPSHAQEPATLKFAFMPPPQSPYIAQAIAPWKENVEKASQGTVKIEIFYGPQLANYNNVLDRIGNAVVEIAYGIFGNLGNQFPDPNVTILPFESEDAETPSVALWRLYAQGLVHFDAARPLALFVFPYSSLHASKPVHTLEDMKGIKLGVFSRQLGEMTELIGGTPVSLQPTDVYQSMSRGVIQATLIGWAGVPTFKLQEMAPQHLDAPLGNSPGFIVMGKPAYERLPDVGKRAIDAYSYEKFSRAMGQSGDRQANGARGFIGGMAGQSVYRLAPAEEARWRKQLEPISEEWVKTTPNGAAILEAYRAEMKKIRAEK